MPDLIGKYKLLEELGRGGMGIVYLAEDTDLKRHVALKELILSPSMAEEKRLDTVARFKREARAACRLRHPNIVEVYEAGSEGNRYYIAMELLRGRALGEMIDSGEKISLDKQIQIIVCVCDALEFAHDHGVVHRDIKPDNIQILESGEVKLMDFGVARLIDTMATELTKTGAMLGTVAYVSPEALQDSKFVDGRTDIFSLGAVLYELLTGKRPFEAGSVGATILKIISEEPTPPSRINPGIPAKLEKIIARALQKEASDRFQNIAEMRRELETCLDGESKPSGATKAPVSAAVAQKNLRSPPTPPKTPLAPATSTKNSGGFLDQLFKARELFTLMGPTGETIHVGFARGKRTAIFFTTPSKAQNYVLTKRLNCRLSRIKWKTFEHVQASLLSAQVRQGMIDPVPGSEDNGLILPIGEINLDNARIWNGK